MTKSWDPDAISVLIRPAATADIPAITGIYAHHVRQGIASFEEVPPAEDEMGRRFEDIAGKSLPHWSGVLEGDIVGFSHASFYCRRSAYRFTLEDSVYLKDSATGRGVGKLPLARLIEEAELFGYRQIIAVIGDRARCPSVRLHEARGFAHVGVLSSVGFNHARWVDTVLIRRALGGGDETAPEEVQ